MHNVFLRKRTDSAQICPLYHEQGQEGELAARAALNTFDTRASVCCRRKLRRSSCDQGCAKADGSLEERKGDGSNK